MVSFNQTWQEIQVCSNEDHAFYQSGYTCNDSLGYFLNLRANKSCSFPQACLSLENLSHVSDVAHWLLIYPHHVKKGTRGLPMDKG